jgi:hypothetical protein
MINPLTGREITIGGSTYKRLLNEGHIKSSSPTPSSSSFNFVAPPVPVFQSPNSNPTPSVTTFQSSIPSPNPSFVSTFQSPIPSPNPSFVSTFQSPIPNPSSKIIPSSVIISSNIPNINTYDQKIQTLIFDEQLEREKVCKICDEYYVDRIKNLKPFKSDELPLLKKILSNCDRCQELHTFNDSRTGKVNQKTLFYKQASQSCKAKIQELENKLSTDTIKFLHSPVIKNTPSTDYLFPQIPK